MIAKTVRYGSLLLALLGVAAIVFVTRFQGKKEMPPTNPPPTVIPAKPFQHSVAAAGILEALSENVAVGVPVPGVVSEVAVQVNDVVRTGDVLFRIDVRELQAERHAAEAKVSMAAAKVPSAEAALEKVREQYERLKSVENPRAVSREDVGSRARDVEIARAEVQIAMAEKAAAESELKRVDVLIDRLTVRAPRDGTVLQANVRVGEFAATSPEEPAMIIGETGRLQARVDVDEQNAARVRPGMRAEGTLKGDPSVHFPLKFVRIEPFVIPKISLTGAGNERVDTRVLQVIYSLDRPEGAPLYVGQQIDVHIEAAAP
ncbi:MAG: HlyD family efflux transporter periplasmic adaptor subunit [Verrucomicrobiota bacterium]